MERAIPFDRAVEGLADAPHRVPAELGRGLGAVDREQARLIGLGAARHLAARAAAPQADQLGHDPLDRPHVALGRTEIPGAVETRAVLCQALGQHQEAAHRLEHVLPGPHGEGIAERERRGCGEGAHGIRHQAVARPVAAADDIARAHRDDADRTGPHGEIAVAVGVDHQLGRGLAGAVGLAAAEAVDLAIAPGPFLVGVDLVGGHHDDRGDAVRGAQRLEQMGRAHDVGGVGADRIGEGVAHQRLGGEVEDDLGPRGGDRVREPGRVAHVGHAAVDIVGEANGGEEVRVGRRRQRIAGDAGAQARQPQAEPAADEAGVTRDEHPAVAPETIIYADSRHSFQVCQGAWPRFHMSLSSCISRKVSMHCQKP